MNPLNEGAMIPVIGHAKFIMPNKVALLLAVVFSSIKDIRAGIKKAKATLKIMKKGVTKTQFFIEAMKKGGVRESKTLINSILFFPSLVTSTPLGSINKVAMMLDSPITNPICTSDAFKLSKYNGNKGWMI
jgi:hypothetical protein